MRYALAFVLCLFVAGLVQGASKVPKGLGVKGDPTERALVVYSSRKSHLIQPLVELYKKETGDSVEIVNGDAGVLIQRLKQEGAGSPADVFMTVDVGNLWYAASQNLFQPLGNEGPWINVPKQYRDTENRWVGLSLRARTIFYNKTKVKPSEIESYENLASKKFKGRLCLRTSRKVYNQSLVASMVDRLGPQKTSTVVEGWVQNLAKPVFTSDTLLLEAIDRGQCDIGIANTYYLARLQKKGEAKNVAVYWPNQKKSTGGVHVNASGAGVLKTSGQPEKAKKFLKFLLGDKAQKRFAELNDEYPVRSEVPMSDLLKSWGSFEKDQRPLSVYGRLQKKAIQIMDKAQYR